MRLRGLHRGGTMALSVVMMVIGVALLVQAAAGVGSLSVRLLAGVLFLAAGAGRLYVERRRPPGGGIDARREAGRADANGAGDAQAGPGRRRPRP